jgi:hypothetical protein
VAGDDVNRWVTIPGSLAVLAQAQRGVIVDACAGERARWDSAQDALGI